MSEIDWNAPLEAYHPDGRVVEVTLTNSSGENPDDAGDYYTTSPDKKQFGIWNPDGRRWGSDSNDFRIRNRKQPEAPTLPVTVELWERVKALLPAVVHGAPLPDSPFDDVEDEARAILAELNPPKVDPLLEAAAYGIMRYNREDTVFDGPDKQPSQYERAMAQGAVNEIRKRGLTITQADAGGVK